MKHGILMIICLFVSLTALAHGPLSEEKKEEIYEARLQYIAKKLEITSEQFEKFSKVYHDYVFEIGFPPAPTKLREPFPSDESKLSSQQAYDMALNRIKFQRKILNAQENAIKKLKDILSPKQLLDFTDVESNMGRKAHDMRNRHRQGKELKDLQGGRKKYKIKKIRTSKSN